MPDYISCFMEACLQVFFLMARRCKYMAPGKHIYKYVRHRHGRETKQHHLLHAFGAGIYG